MQVIAHFTSISNRGLLQNLWFDNDYNLQICPHLNQAGFLTKPRFEIEAQDNSTVK